VRINSRRYLIAAVLFLALAAGGAASAEPMISGAGGPGEAAPGAAAASAILPVEHQQVCMVTNRVLGRPQLAVEFEGRTYYGCCPVCVGRIKGDRRVRYSADPLTGAEVDKARAYIVEGPGGAALYFASSDTAAEFARLHSVASPSH